jgi:Zn-dependent protease
MAKTAASRSFHVMTLAGVRVHIDPSWFFVFALVLWSLTVGYFPRVHPGRGWLVYTAVGLLATLLFFASVLIHELAHAVVGNSLGSRVRDITLFVFGGMASLSSESRTPAVEAKIAGVGPLTSLALGALFWILALLLEEAAGGGMVAGVFGYLAVVNLALAVFNLLPGYPLDGGRLLRAFFWHRSGDLREATARAARWGAGVALGLIVLGALQIFSGALLGGFWLILIGLFLRNAAEAGYRGMVTEQVLSDVRVRDLMVTHPIVVPADATLADAIERYFLRYGYGGFPVLDDGRVAGLLSLRDVRETAPEERERRLIRDVLRPIARELVADPDEPAASALRRMLEADTGRLLVMDGDRLAGLVTRTGIGRYAQLSEELGRPRSADSGRMAA